MLPSGGGLCLMTSQASSICFSRRTTLWRSSTSSLTSQRNTDPTSSPILTTGEWKVSIERSTEGMVPQALTEPSTFNAEPVLLSPTHSCMHLQCCFSPACVLQVQYCGYMLDIFMHKVLCLAHMLPQQCCVCPCAHRAGNEPDLLAVYLFCFAGRADLTQKVNVASRSSETCSKVTSFNCDMPVLYHVFVLLIIHDSPSLWPLSTMNE